MTSAPDQLRVGVRRTRVPPIQALVFEIRQAWHSIVRRPALTATVCATLAIGIAATSTIFTVVNAVLLRPLPYPEPDRLYQLNVLRVKTSRLSPGQSPQNFLDLRAGAAEVADLGGYTAGTTFTVAGDGEPERVAGSRVSASLWPTLRVGASVGRVFTAGEDDPGRSPTVAVVSEGFAERHFGTAFASVGRLLLVDAQPYTIIGVMPGDFAFPSRGTDLWIPLASTYADGGRGNFFVDVVARVRAGVPADRAEVVLRAEAATLARTYPEDNTGLSVALTPLHAQLTESIRRILRLLAGAAVLLLVVACANITNLLLVRAAERRQEVALRQALGAERLSVVRQFLAESLLLAACGTLMGIVGASACVRLLSHLTFLNLPLVGALAVDGTATLFTVVLGFAAGLGFGLFPALQAIRVGSSEVTHRSGSRVANSAAFSRWLLVATEVALSVVLLASAAVLLRSLGNVLQVDPGFRTTDLVTFDVSVPVVGYNRQASGRFFAQAASELAGIPDVHAVGATTALPLSGDDNVRYFTLEGRRGDAPSDYTSTAHRFVTAGYFSALDIPVRRGRAFGSVDYQGNAAPTAIVNEAFVARFLAGRDPIGVRLKVAETTTAAAPWSTIVGVIGDVRHSSLEVVPTPEVYRPITQLTATENERKMTFALWTSRPVADVIRDARDRVRRLDANVPIARPSTMASLVAGALARRRLTARLLEAFAGSAFVLTLIGIYGVVAYTANLERRSLAIRLALGATRGRLMSLVVRPSALAILAGLGTGLLLTVAARHVVAALLFEVSPTDPVSLLAVCGLVTFVGVSASSVPARRAAKLDPIIVLRSD